MGIVDCLPFSLNTCNSQVWDYLYTYLNIARLKKYIKLLRSIYNVGTVKPFRFR